MKRNIFMMAAVALLAMACAKEQQPASENPFDFNEGVTEIRVTVPTTKAAIAEQTGVCTWQNGDKIAIFFASEIDQETDKPTAGTRLEFTYDGLYEDGSAKFVTTGEVPAEFVRANAAYPAAALNDKGAQSLIRDYVYSTDSVPVYLVGSVTVNEGALSAHLTYNASIMKFTLHDIPAYAAGFVLYSKRPDTVDEEGKTKPGTEVTIKTTFPYKTGYTSDPSSNANDIVLYSAIAHSSVPKYVYLIDGDGVEIEGSRKNFTGDQAVTYDDFIIMPRIDFKKAQLRKDFVKVKGVKWAKGNLQCIRGTEESGFQGGWRLAPAQWHHLTYKDNPSKAEAYSYTNTSDNYEHFNYGGIARQARFMSDGNYIQPKSTTLDISGKMYSDVHATNEVTGLAALEEIDSFASSNHNRLWGDIAFWASKGKFRMPTAAEFKTLHNEVHKLTGEYTTPDGLKVYGTLFRTVLPGENRQGTDGHVFTDADLESGLFLPKAGRKYDGTGYVINSVTTQGTYRSSTFVKSVDLDNNDTWTNLEKKYISAYYHISGSTAKGYGPNMTSVSNDFGHSAAYLIRPVLAD